MSFRNVMDLFENLQSRLVLSQVYQTDFYRVLQKKWPPYHKYFISPFSCRFFWNFQPSTNKTIQMKKFGVLYQWSLVFFDLKSGENVNKCSNSREDHWALKRGIICFQYALSCLQETWKLIFHQGKSFWIDFESKRWTF